jgi:magnesium chelatase accessory protein
LAPPSRLPGDWPHRAWSRSVSVGALDWHVQVAGHGPTVLLLHGSGASAHSWAEVMPALVAHATVVVPDLPGHGFTTGAPLACLTLPRVTADLAALLAALRLPAPTLLAGHSAGAALALRWALDAQASRAGFGVAPRGVIGFNPSLVAPPEVYLRLMAPLINPLATSAPVAWLLAAVAPATGLVDRLLDSTKSELGAEQRARYRRLFARADHVQGTLGFMAAADLPALLAEGPALKTAPCFVLGTRDEWVPPAPLRRAIERGFPRAESQLWPGGHLLHEESPQRAAALMLEKLAAR